VTCKDTDQKYTGLIREIRLDKWGHQRNVYVMWCKDVPPQRVPVSGYNPEHGYSGVNIHNCRNEFDVIRNGVSIK
jgi:hypothetical protein